MSGFTDYLEACGAAKHQLCFTRGDTCTLSFVIKDARGVRVPLDGYTGVLEFSATEGGTVGHTGTVVLSSATPGNPDVGLVTLTIPVATSRLLPPRGFYRFAVTAPGGEVKTLLCGYALERRLTEVPGCGIGPDGLLTGAGVSVGCGSSGMMSGGTCPKGGSCGC